MNFKSNLNKNTFLSWRKYCSVVLLLGLWGISPQLKASNSLPQPAAVTQQKTIRGIVLDELNEPMIGVSIMEKGTTNGTITDINGNFQIGISKPNATLVFSYIGYTKQELSAGTSALKIILAPDSKQIDEVVVVGYAKQKKESVVGSIAQVTGDALKARGGVTDITNALSGSMPGVTVMTLSGNPGGGGEMGDDSKILIRGMATWNGAGPLILVDGMERKMNDVEINEIETFSVLKDASATAVFGVKGANGVILITTKRGTLGKPKVNFEASTAIKSLSKVEKVLDSYGGLLARNYALVNELALNNSPGWGVYYTPARLLGYYKDQTDPERYPSVDWQDVMLRDNTTTNKYSINISGGTDFVKYFTSLAYITDGDLISTTKNVRGYAPEFKYDRYNFRTNLDFTLTKTTQFKVGLSGYYGKQQLPSNGIHNMWYGVYKHSPTAVPVYSDGTYGSDESTSDRFGINSYMDVNSKGSESNSRTSITSDFELVQKLDFISKGLSVKGRISYDNYFATSGPDINDNQPYTTKRFDVATNVWQYTKPALGSNGFDNFTSPLGYTAENINGTAASATQRNLYYEASLNYNRKFGKHNIGALGLWSRQQFATGNSWPVKREDWVGRITYDFEGKYLFEVNAAYNGSDQFGPGYKFDFFPSIALGWRISEEKFITDNIPQISNLKIRYSIGGVGNDKVGNLIWPYVTTWNPGYPYVQGSNTAANHNPPFFGSGVPVKTPYPGIIEGTPGNPDLHWEKAQKQNFGIELGLFDGLFSGTADFFKEHRYEMLMAGDNRSAVPDFFGNTPVAANLGEVNTHGVELDFKLQKNIGKVNLWASYNWTQAINNIVYKEDPELSPAYQQNAGYSINQIKTQVTSGIVQSWDQMYTGVMYETSNTNTNLIPGDYRMVDYNSDGTINSNDGIPNSYAIYPQNTYGFSLGADYAGFSAMVQFYGNYNVSVDESQLQEFDYSAPIIYGSLLDRSFTPEYGNTNPDYRSLSIKRGSPTGNGMIYDASFLRLKTAELSYTFPKSFTQKVSIDNLRFYVNGNNLLYWSKLPIDVEGAGAEIKRYPNTKQINFGLNVTF